MQQKLKLQEKINISQICTSYASIKRNANKKKWKKYSLPTSP